MLVPGGAGTRSVSEMEPVGRIISMAGGETRMGSKKGRLEVAGQWEPPAEIASSSESEQGRPCGLWFGS